MEIFRDKNYCVTINHRNRVVSVKETDEEEGEYKANLRKKTKRREVAPGHYVEAYIQTYGKECSKETIAEAVREWIRCCHIPPINFLKKRKPKF